MKDLEDIKMGDLRSAVKALNDTGLLEEKIRVAGIKKEEIVEKFTKAIEGFEEGAELPAVVIDFYSDLYADEIEEEPEKEEKEEKKEKVTKKDKKTTDKEKKETRKTGKKSRYGHAEGSQAAQLDDLLYKGATLEEMMEAIDSTKARVNSHIYHLKTKKELNIVKNKEGKYKVKK